MLRGKTLSGEHPVWLWPAQAGQLLFSGPHHWAQCSNEISLRSSSRVGGGSCEVQQRASTGLVVCSRNENADHMSRLSA